jgi:hypothetical protein
MSLFSLVSTWGCVVSSTALFAALALHYLLQEQTAARHYLLHEQTAAL